MYCLRIVPKWVTGLVTADLACQQSRISIPKNFVKANLVPMLSELERESASLDGDDRKRSRVTEAAEAEKPKTKVSEREHGGLPVVVFTRCRFRCYLKLTHWDDSAGTVIKGNELKYFALWSFLKEGDEVATWAFRRGDDLCFDIGQPTSASSSSCASRHLE